MEKTKAALAPSPCFLSVTLQKSKLETSPNHEIFEKELPPYYMIWVATFFLDCSHL
jgi:hypothetical protein